MGGGLNKESSLFQILAQISSVSGCYGSLSGGGVGLGVRILSNRIRWGGSLHLGWHLCCGVVRGAWKWLNYSKFSCTTRRRAFSTRPVYFVVTPSSNPPSLYLFILWLFCIICYSSIVSASHSGDQMT